MGATETNHRVAKIKSFSERLRHGKLKGHQDRKTKKNLDELVGYLAQSHQTLKSELLKSDPVLLEKFVHLNSDQEFALMLYWALEWADNPPDWFETWLGRTDSEIFRIAYDVLKHLLKDYEHYKMSKKDYKHLMKKAVSPGLVGGDGTIFGTGKYEQLDPGWMISTLNYILNIIHPRDIYQPFPTRDISPIAMSSKDGASEPVLGIIGDWGAGFYEEAVGKKCVPCPAQRVIEEVQKQKFDYLIHLGDTYYAGTNESRPGPGTQKDQQEEQRNLVDVWPKNNNGRNYTLNSNHEMYGAAQGYFDTALTQSGLFQPQNGASLFALTYPIEENGRPTGKSWLVLGLDSAYYSDVQNGIKMYMAGAIGSSKFFDKLFNKHQKQIKKIKSICAGHTGPIMVMTHHNPCDTLTAKTNILYDQVVKAIGQEPALWVWGHVHNGIVYDKMTIEKSGGLSLNSGTKSRCCGHAAVPFGLAWSIESDPNILYLAKTHDDAFPKDSPRVKNGYALYTLHNDGGFSESFYEVGDTKKAVFTKRWKPGEVSGN